MRRTSLTVLVAVLMVVLAGCSGFEGLPGGGNGSAPPQVTEDSPTPEPTPESTEAADGEESPGGGETGNLDNLLPWLGLLLVLVVGFAAFGVLYRRNRSDPVSAEAPRSDGEEVISLLHRNNGRVFEDVLEEELDWSPAHTRRVLDGLVATGDVERTQTQRGVLVTFTDPDRRLENESAGGGEDEDDV